MIHSINYAQVLFALIAIFVCGALIGRMLTHVSLRYVLRHPELAHPWLLKLREQPPFEKLFHAGRVCPTCRWPIHIESATPFASEAHAREKLAEIRVLVNAKSNEPTVTAVTRMVRSTNNALDDLLDQEEKIRRAIGAGPKEPLLPALQNKLIQMSVGDQR